MTAPRRARLSATLMLLLFVTLGGGLGVSGFDVLLFHLNQREELPIAHVEPAGANCHAESCLIGYAVSGGRFLSSTVPTSQLHLPDSATPAPLERTYPAPSVWLASPLPRSPPRLTL